MSNLQTRILSAIVLGAVVLVLTWLGGAPYRLLIALIAVAIFYEWSRMARPAPGQAWGEGGLGPLPDVAIAIIAVLLVTNLSPSLLVLVSVAIVAFTGAVAWQRGVGPTSKIPTSCQLLPCFRASDIAILVLVSRRFRFGWSG